MPATDVEIVSAALVALGDAPITSLEDDGAGAEAARALYPFVRSAMLTVHRWGFASAQAELAKLAAIPVADYDFAYALPADFLHAVALGGQRNRGRGWPYRVAEGRVHTNADPAILSYVYDAPEAIWPPHFVALMRAQLRAELCMAVTEDHQRYGAFLQQAELELSRAKRIDSQQATPIVIQSFPLIDARG